MPFYFRKSVSAGPFRFNFSSAGVGVSVGVRGLRIGTGPRGHYIHAGRNGLYYRASLGRTSARPSPRLQSVNATPPPLQAPASVDLIEIESANVVALQDETFADLLRELNEKARQTRLAVVVPVALGILGFSAVFVVGPQGIWLAPLAVPGWLFGRWLDSYKRTSVLFFDLDGERQGGYSRLTNAFDNLMGCGGKWHVQARGAIYDLMTQKRNAGATSLVNRKDTRLTYALPTVIKSNVTPPSLHAGRQTLYFFPDVVLIADGAQFGAVSYAELRVDYQQSRFIEDGRVPSDAQVVDYTWQYTNKKGGPDRRFNNNRQLSVCLYDSLHLSSPSGLNELFQFSRNGVGGGLAVAVDDMRNVAPSSPSAALSPALPSPRPWEPDQPAPTDTPPPEKRRYAVKAAIGFIVVGALYALVAPSREMKETAAPRTPVATSAPIQVLPPPVAAPKAEDKPPIAASQTPATPAQPTPSPKDDSPLSTVEVRELQERLKALGFDPGTIDGIPGPQTAAAIRRFEASASLPAQGNMDRATLQSHRARPGSANWPTHDETRQMPGALHGRAESATLFSRQRLGQVSAIHM